MADIRRRQLMLATAAALATPHAARAQAPTLPVVAYVFGGRSDAELAGPDPKHPHARAFVHRLRELGREDGRTMKLERYGPGNDAEQAQRILADLATRNVAVIFAASAVRGTLVAIMAMKQTRSVPIVFAGGSDPVAAGLVASLARPGGNVTGITTDAGPQIIGKRLQLLKELLPGVTKIAYLGTPSPTYREIIREAAAQLRLDLIAFEVDGAKKLDEAFARTASEGAQAMVVATLGFLYAQSPRIVAFAAERRLPVLYAFPEAVDAGGLAAYGIDILDLNRRAADYVDKILRGAKPADLPVELPRKFELVVNLKAAKALGLKVPQSVLLQADRVIE